MKELIKHLWKTNREEIVAKSRRNCHARGLHSVMLLESPGKTIRMFLADWNHELYHNSFPARHAPESDGLSVAIHPHHCSITLFGVLGFFINERIWILTPRYPATCFWPELRQFVFDSKLRGGSGGFSLGDLGPHLYQPDSEKIGNGTAVHMSAKELHTVYVPKEERAAWFVFEGLSDPDYKPICYSNRDLTQFTSEGLYEQPEEKEIERWLRIAQVL